MRKLSGVLALVLAVSAACSKPRIDTSSDEAMAASMKAVAESLPEKDRERFSQAMMQIAAASTFEQMSAIFAKSLAGGKAARSAKPAADLMKRANGLTGTEVIALADQLAGEMKTKEEAASQATKREAEATAAKEATEKATQAAYFPSVEISRFKMSKGKTYGDEPAAFVEGEVKNRGEKTLNEVEVTFVYLDNSGRAVHEETFHPVLVTSMSFGGNNGPLKPNYSRTFRAGFKNPPADWAGKMDAKITGVRFAE